MKRKILLLFLVFLFPILVFAYDKVIPGGETIGIEVKSDGVLVVGFYAVDGTEIGRKAGFTLGDRIVKINDTDVHSITDMMNVLQNSNTECHFGIIRNNREKTLTLPLIYEDQRIKTGLYVKDQIHGLGTLSFILENKKFGSLGHEIMEANTLEKFQVGSGEIYKGEVVDIIKSRDGSAGEKNASYDKSEITGSITSNEITGIYGDYYGELKDTDYVEIGSPDDVKVGDAVIRTVITKDQVEEFTIKILDIKKNDETKNLLFEITDQRLLDATGGVVQGMSGSPILQNGKMIGVVNYVLVNEPKKGYGIFLTKMLEEIE
ncbi:MAG: PDZ domain-containing protein [Bacilli bacterium]|nr:PDZ domain-containing protein [Bacilli bacterium]